MSAEYMHIGIPVTTKKPNMVYNDVLKFWVNTDVDAYDYKIEYLKFDEGTPFPEIMHKNPHVAYKVDDMEPYLQIRLFLNHMHLMNIQDLHSSSRMMQLLNCLK